MPHANDPSENSGTPASVNLKPHEAILAKLEEANTDALMPDGLDEALIGIADRAGAPPVALYSYDLCVEIFVRGGMSYEDALEWMEHNVVCAFLGAHTPIFARELALPAPGQPPG